MSPDALTQKAMLVSLTIKVPSTTKKDKQATQEVTQSHHAEEGVARVNKTLYPKEATQGFMQAAREARAVFYEKTLPWASPQRILLASGYFKLMESLDKCQSRFWKEAEKFLENYDEKIVEARKELGSLFREEDYPTREELMEKFEFDVNVQPLTNTSDWRVSLGNEAEERIKRQMEEHLKASFREAAREPWERLGEVLKNMAERLSDPEARFAGTLVTNISDLCQILPDLNIMDDPRLEKIASEVKEKLASQSPKDLRTDMKLRRQTANEAKKMAELVDMYAGSL
jgi:hypothetical protein